MGKYCGTAIDSSICYGTLKVRPRNVKCLKEIFSAGR
jgi:hypothetical protein